MQCMAWNKTAPYQTCEWRAVRAKGSHTQPCIDKWALPTISGQALPYTFISVYVQSCLRRDRVNAQWGVKSGGEKQNPLNTL